MAMDCAAHGNSDALFKSFWLSFPSLCVKPEKLTVGQSLQTLPHEIRVQLTPVCLIIPLWRDSRDNLVGQPSRHVALNPHFVVRWPLCQTACQRVEEGVGCTDPQSGPLRHGWRKVCLLCVSSESGLLCSAESRTGTSAHGG